MAAQSFTLKAKNNKRDPRDRYGKIGKKNDVREAWGCPSCTEEGREKARHFEVPQKPGCKGNRGEKSNKWGVCVGGGVGGGGGGGGGGGATKEEGVGGKME